MKRGLSFLTIIILFIFVSKSNAQLFKIGVGGGYTTINSPDELTNSISDGGAGFGGGAIYGGKVIASLPLIPINITGKVYYSPYSGEESGIEITSSLLSVSLGGEFTLIPGPVKPYLGADLLYSSFGDVEVNGQKVEDGEGKTGLGVDVGVYFTLLPMIDLDLSYSYYFNSLLSSGDDVNTSNIVLNILFSFL